jgi:membrane-associated phospholipid phosphatase
MSKGESSSNFDQDASSTTAHSTALILVLQRWELAVSQWFFELSVPYSVECLWSIPGNWFGLPTFCMIGPLWLMYLQQHENSSSSLLLPTICVVLTIGLAILWTLFLNGYERIMSKGIFSHHAFALGPIFGIGLCVLLEDDVSFDDKNISGIGLYHILLYSSSVVPILIIKHWAQRHRPAVHRPHLISRKYLQIIPKLQNKWGPRASFPSGDAMGSMAFVVPHSTLHPKLATTFLIMTITGRMYFLAHYLGDVLAGAFIPWILHLHYQELLGINVDNCQWWQPLMAQTVFIAVGLSRKSNQK